MRIYYFDPSAWIKRHFEEAGSETVAALFRASVEAACCRLGLIEMVATVARKSSRDPIDAAAVQTLLNNVHADFSAFHVIPVDEPCFKSAETLALHHRLRTMDALHLACALTIHRNPETVPALRVHVGLANTILDELETVMVSSDIALLAASSAEGLETLNPADATA